MISPAAIVSAAFFLMAGPVAAQGPGNPAQSNAITPPVIPPGAAPYTGDAASDIGAIGWHEMGFYGKYLENSVEKRVKVGIIDRVFQGFTAAANNGDLPPLPSGNRTESDRVKTKCDDRLTPDSDTRRDNRPFIGTPAHTISPRPQHVPAMANFG